jgi:HEAT repeat protein
VRVRVGLPEFDARVDLRGDEVELVARLDGRTRRRLLWATEAGAHLRSGAFRWRAKGPLEVAEVALRVELLSSLLSRFGRPVELPQVLLQNIRRAGDGRVRERNLALLFRAFPHHPTSEEAVALALADDHPGVRLLGAMRALGEGFPALRALAESERAPLPERLRALRYLASTFAPERVHPVLFRCLKSAAAKVRHQAVVLMGRSGAQDAFDVLAELVFNPDDELAAAAAQALSDTGDLRACAVLRGRLEQGAGAQVATAAVRSLAVVGSLSARAFLTDMIDSARWRLWTAGLAQEARAALESLERRLEANPFPILSFAVLNDPEADVRRGALVELMARLPHRPEVTELAEQAVGDEDARVRAVAASRLLERGFEPLVELLREADAPATAKLEALRHLARTFERTRTAPLVRGALNDPDRRVRLMAARLLGEIREPSGIPRLINLLEADDPKLVAAAAEGLSQYRDSTLEPHLLRLLGHGDRGVQQAALDGLGRMGTQRSVPRLLSIAAEGPGRAGLRRAARAAIDRIQARLAGAEAGQLSLIDVEADEGALSMAESHAGRLSVPPSREPGSDSEAAADS